VVIDLTLVCRDLFMINSFMLMTFCFYCAAFRKKVGGNILNDMADGIHDTVSYLSRHEHIMS